MQGLTKSASTNALRDPDQRIFFRGVSWSDFETLLAIRGDQAGVRVTYREGELELMSPSRTHEGIKTALARILEAYALERGVTLEGFGSWTLKSAPDERGLEPDECYILGEDPDDERIAPDLAIEVIWTSGGIDKLDVYSRLGGGEVWLWEDGAITVHVLRGDRYELSSSSELLPDFDLARAARCVADAATQTAAVRAFLDAVRGDR